MFCTIIGGLIFIAIIAVILAVILQIASKMALKEAIEFGDAFKTAFVASIVAWLVDKGVEQMMGADAGGTLLISIGTTYIIWVLALSIIVDLTLRESLIVAAIFTAIKILLALVFVAILTATIATSGG